MTIAKPKFTGIPEAIASKPFRLLERSCRRWQLKVVVIDLREPLLSRHAPQVLIPASNPNRPLWSNYNITFGGSGFQFQALATIKGGVVLRRASCGGRIDYYPFNIREIAWYVSR